MELKVAELVRSNLIFHNLNKRAENQLGISLVQFYILNILRNMPGCSPQRLADTAGMHPSSLTQTLKRLQKKNAIYIGDDPKDSRKKILSMTRVGRDLVDGFSLGIENLLKPGNDDL